MEPSGNAGLAPRSVGWALRVHGLSSVVLLPRNAHAFHSRGQNRFSNVVAHGSFSAGDFAHPTARAFVRGARAS
jgi:hypothetical protein